MIDENDKSTIISIIPFEFVEFKPGVYPGSFRIPECLDEKNPTLFYVGQSEAVMQVPNAEPLHIVTPSQTIARSIVEDFVNAQLWTTPTARPGIACLPGLVTKVALDSLHGKVLDNLRAQQRAWFVNVCNHTSSEWNQYKSIRVVSHVARFAAKYLGLDPEWLAVEVAGFQMEKCPACRTPCPNDAIVCAHCRAVLNKTTYAKLAFAAA